MSKAQDWYAELVELGVRSRKVWKAGKSGSHGLAKGKAKAKAQAHRAERRNARKELAQAE